MPLNPKQQRNLHRIIPFGIIWLITGWIFLLVESLATENQNPQSDSVINLTLPVFIFASIAVTLAGILVGITELILLEKRFKNYSFLKKVTYKFFIYLALMLGIIGLAYPIASAIEMERSLFDPKIWFRTLIFFQSIVFLNTMIQLSFQLILSLLYAAISENLGHQVLLNFFTGKYHSPKAEERIFMFLDMKNSTTIAEKIGDTKYFDLLNMYYNAMSDSIINSYGEVYQYVGDEVVVSWKKKEGLINNSCITCFKNIKKHIQFKHDEFLKKFDVIPDFKAGIHLGQVTTGEIGALKKEIIFTGDVLNTTARIQSLCNEYDSDLLISNELLSSLPEKVNSRYVDTLILRGKLKETKIYSVVSR
ncbi:adenylate/guanylate cyclase domain-containing protein [Mangrovivirga cuniculi]|uniref:Adenylate/guanylate cyclase domain-containing protein n=1 Tax=Mangrovivirga cuniculi TaxID=2715131 RepID=A0A4D7K439_9BACT|nr:adenylate/guanylate cyclase domain-containing protein [Mangrovivirga cuniculi]QCK14198.1 adenylate/guanylate cyclase domain-containing protein [Mangrovivirga cuniculi]